MKKQIVLDEKDLSDLEALIVAYERANIGYTTPENIQAITDKFRGYMWDI